MTGDPDSPGDLDPDRSVAMSPIGRVHSPFKGKFGAPRQPGLVPAATGEVEFFAPFDDPDAVRGLEGFSHIWIIFLAHLIPGDDGFQPTVRPPRLGGNTRLGVFATRSLFRPNRLGLSLCRLDKVVDSPRASLHVSGLDLVDGTPVFDIKPYVPYTEAIADARAGFAPAAPAPLAVSLDPAVVATMENIAAVDPGFHDLLVQTLANDPRPAYHPADGRAYAMDLSGVKIRFTAEPGGGIRVVSLG